MRTKGILPLMLFLGAAFHPYGSARANEPEPCSANSTADEAKSFAQYLSQQPAESKVTMQPWRATRLDYRQILSRPLEPATLGKLNNTGIWTRIGRSFANRNWGRVCQHRFPGQRLESSCPNLASRLSGVAACMRATTTLFELTTTTSRGGVEDPRAPRLLLSCVNGRWRVVSYGIYQLSCLPLTRGGNNDMQLSSPIEDADGTDEME